MSTKKTLASEISAFVLKRFMDKRFNAADVQGKFGDKKTLINLSTIRLVLNKLCKDGKIACEGKGRSHCYVLGNPPPVMPKVKIARSEPWVEPTV